MQAMFADLKNARRVLFRRPGLSLMVAVTLALGIGASSAVFNVVNSVILSSLPYAEPDRVVRLLGHRQGEDVSWGTISYPNFLDIRERNRSFSAMAAYDEWTPMLRLERPALLAGASVNASFFDVLGIKPALGRLFLPAEDEPGAAASVVITHELWSNRFNADPAVVGSTLDLSGTPYTVVGVLPRDFEDLGLSGGHFHAPQVWRVTPSYFGGMSRNSRSFTAIARLAPDATLDSASAELDALMNGLRQAYPQHNSNRVMQLRSLEDDILGGARPGLWLLFGAVGLLLAVACVNVANLMLVRSANRAREFGVRNTLGATRWAISRQVLLECVALSVIGGIAGMVLAGLATNLLHGMLAAALPRQVPLVFDWQVLAFAAGVSVLAGIVSSVLPIVETGRMSTVDAIKEGNSAAGSRRLAARMRWLIGAQMALTLALFLTAMLLARSLANLVDVDPGVRTENVLSLQVDALGSDYPEHADVSALYAELLPRAAGVPGVTDAGAISILPFSGSFNGNTFALLDRPAPPRGERPGAETRSASPGFFRAAGVPLRRGRLIDDTDRATTRRVVVVNETFAKTHFPEQDPLGARIALFDEEWEIVGVVGDVHQFALDRQPEPAIYTPHAQNPNLWMRRDMTLFIRTAGDPLAIASELRTAIWSVAPNVAIENVRTMEAVLAATFSPQRFRTLLLSMFAAAALLLGAVGIYGVVAYSVAQRTREVGVRMAIGARAPELVRMMVMQGMGPALAGGAVGLAAGIGIAHFLQGMFFGISPTDPATVLLAAGALGAIGLAASWLPAQRAARIRPAEALHHE